MDTKLKEFAFALGERVKIDASGEAGVVIARSDHADASDQYLIRYADANGVASEHWWSVSALSSE